MIETYRKSLKEIWYSDLVLYPNVSCWMLDKWYWILPNAVLFDKELSDKQKLLFCLISSLCAKEWFCWATNEYLWSLLDAHKITISKNIAILQEKWLIVINKDAENWRKIALSENAKGGKQKCLGGISENANPYIYMNITNEYIIQNFYWVSKYWVDNKKCNKLIDDKLKQWITLEDIRIWMVLYNNECRLRWDWEHLMKLETWLDRFRKSTKEQIEDRLIALVSQHKKKKETDDKYRKSERAKTLWNELCDTFGEDKVNSIYKAEWWSSITLKFT